MDGNPPFSTCGDEILFCCRSSFILIPACSFNHKHKSLTLVLMRGGSVCVLSVCASPLMPHLPGLLSERALEACERQPACRSSTWSHSHPGCIAVDMMV